MMDEIDRIAAARAIQKQDEDAIVKKAEDIKRANPARTERVYLGQIRFSGFIHPADAWLEVDGQIYTYGND